MSSPMDLLFDPNVLIVQDHFVSNDGVADTTVGQLGWEIATLDTNASTIAYQTTGFGVLRDTTGAGAADGTGYRLKVDTAVAALGTHFKARVRLVTAIIGNSFRCGLMDTQTITEPAVGIFFTGTAGVMVGEVDSAAGDNSSATLLTATIGQWMTLEFLASGKANAAGGPAEVLFRITDEASPDVEYSAQVISQLTSAETMELSFVHWGTAATVFEIDYIGYQQVR